MKIEDSKLRKFDPEPFAIATIVIAGATLLLGLGTKIETRKARNEDLDSRKALSDCAIALEKLSKEFETISKLLDQIQELSLIEPTGKSDLGFGSYSMYLSEEALPIYYESFDGIMSGIGAVNKLVAGMPLDRVPLSDAALKSLSSKISDIRNIANGLLVNPTLENASELAPIILKESIEFTDVARAALQQGPDRRREKGR